jgi:hypothetical protein
MKLTLNTVLAPAFQEAFVAFTQLPLPAVHSYRLAKVLKVLQEEHRAFEVARLASLSKHRKGEELDAPAFRTDIEELLSKEIEICFPEKVVLPPDVRMTPQHLLILDEFIDAKTDPGTGVPAAVAPAVPVSAV